MKRALNGKLNLNKETLRMLDERSLAGVQGGWSVGCSGAECSTPTFSCDTCFVCANSVYGC
jgi:hypothetical protein